MTKGLKNEPFFGVALSLYLNTFIYFLSYILPRPATPYGDQSRWGTAPHPPPLQPKSPYMVSDSLIWEYKKKYFAICNAMIAIYPTVIKFLQKVYNLYTVMVGGIYNE